MGKYLQTDFSAGWNPSADAFQCPPNALLRADNLTLDELGVLALRQGSQKINATALTESYIAFDHTATFETAYFTAVAGSSIAQFTQEWERAYVEASVPVNGPGDHNYAWEVTNGYVATTTIATDTDVHSLFTTALSGTRYRMTGAADAVYANGSAIWASVAGSGDIAFGSHQGQILFARGTTKRKYDGSVVRTWGIAAPNAAPTLSALATDSKIFATCASTEAPGFTSNEGTQTFTTDKSGTANAAVQEAPDTTTGRAVATLTYGAATDFTAYSGGQTGTDDDLIDFYAKIVEPQYLDSIVLLFDVNDGTFQEDWYEFTFHSGDATELIPSTEESLQSNYNVEGVARNLVVAGIEEVETVQSSNLVSAGAQGWSHFNAPRGRLERHGLTSGKNWSTVRAVRVIVNAIAGGSGAAVVFDQIQIIGGAARPLTGKFKAAIVAVYNSGTYQALSAPSAFSSEIEVKAQGIRASLAASVVNALDNQVNELWLYLMGGGINAFYRFATLTGGPFAGAQTIDATSSKITAVAAKLRMETDAVVPPDAIIGIEGPHFDRTLCLTAQFLYGSIPLNPDSYRVLTVNGLPAEGEVVRVGDASETALWVKRLGEASLFVGTTKDIYRLDGDWTPLADGSINVSKRPMHVAEPPISAAVEVGTVNGVETLIYLTGDGWHALGFGPLVNNAVDLLWRGFTRHGVSPVNITSTTARFRCAVAKNVLFCLTPEESSTTSSSVLHAYHFSKQRWYRFTYPQAFRSLYAEADGTLIAGDASGFVRQLDIATKQDDGANIPVVLWTGASDNGQPFTYKDAENLWLRLDTGGSTATVAFHLNGNATADSSTTTSQQTTDTANVNVSTMGEFMALQLRITGSFNTFALRGWGLRYLDNPLPQVIHDTGFVDLSGDILKWVKQIRVKAKSAVSFTVTPYWDGSTGTIGSVPVTGNTATVYNVPMGRQDRGKTGRVVITAASPMHVYWVEFWLSGSGRQTQKRITLVEEAK